jgi:hypothetical protein
MNEPNTNQKMTPESSTENNNDDAIDLSEHHEVEMKKSRDKSPKNNARDDSVIMSALLNTTIPTPQFMHIGNGNMQHRLVPAPSPNPLTFPMGTKKLNKLRRKLNNKNWKKVIRGPRTAWNCFVQHETKQFKAENPGLKITDSMKMLRERWKNMSNDAKTPYKQEAIRDKERYKKQFESLSEDEKKSYLQYKSRKGAKISAPGINVKKPPNKYLIFCMEQRKKLQVMGVDNNEIKKRLPVLWKALTPQEKLPYQKLYQQEKQRYDKWVEEEKRQQALANQQDEQATSISTSASASASTSASSLHVNTKTTTSNYSSSA